MAINDMLIELKDVNASIEVTRLDFEKKRTAVLSRVQDQIDALLASVQDDLLDLDDEFLPLLELGRKRQDELESEVRKAVISSGQTAKVDGLTVSFVNGRTSWDTSALDGYSAAHPEIARFKKIGEPSARLKWG